MPSVGSTAAGYEDYADDNLPSWFQTAFLNASDNTPSDGGFPTNTPENNPITDEGAELGRVLFYDKRLSHNDGVACASCHVQENGFDDPNRFSEGFEGGLTGRHSMGLSNARFYAPGTFFWDQRASSLEDQVLRPIQDSVEMGTNLDQLRTELAATEFYPTLFTRAFGDAEVTNDRIAVALAQFVRSMVSYQSKFDQALAAEAAGGQLSDVLTTQELSGHGLFQQDCAGCHRGNAQVADRAHNIGLDADGDPDADPGVSPPGDGEFKVPSLRNVGAREGFMHDGRFSTLGEVIEFYSTGVQGNANRSRRIPGNGGFNYTDEQEAALVAFLETLTDDAFLTSDLFSDPFVALDGDYNGDGVVDIDDYVVWQNEFGETAPAFGAFFADGNLDGVVDVADYTLWRDNLGARWDDGTGFSLAAVPEPGGVMLIGLAAGTLGLTRRCRRGRQPA